MQTNVLAEQLSAARSGDRAATNGLFATLQPMIMRYCRARIDASGHDHAADVTQEVFIAALSSMHRFRGPETSFLSFVFGIAAHKIADYHRARSRDRTHLAAEPVDGPDPELGPEQRVLRTELGARMRGLLGLLTESQSEILILRVAVGMTADETAAVVGSTPAAVRVAQHRALQKLRRHLSTDNAETIRARRFSGPSASKAPSRPAHGRTAGMSSARPA
ncbi:sigma-70 family RNA polymerase sigma factor [Saccharomonospora xinjiangensis]|uniref:RNA polymerase sigma factor, sigma-70 family n=1 Tax=Saccharomonospora xinjiangensis XJ-54 TaxID=882086 RepID=I0UWT0_9PSEU|nr:sigma-70 family RNA polymerase sigma factor [Saccharomonospora xinjiangensis]EID52333.1 RNA polymerase sigma factor, sigma-70 family [Saccharomonospora xinjiangensis XJ-54]